MPNTRETFLNYNEQVKKFLFLFIVDICRIAQYDNPIGQHKILLEFLQKEPGYVSPWLEAFIYALKTPQNELTIDNVKSIHQMAMAFEPDCNPGFFRTEACQHNIFFREKIPPVVYYNASLKGMEEWLYDRFGSIYHRIMYHDQSSPERCWLIDTFFINIEDSAENEKYKNIGRQEAIQSIKDLLPTHFFLLEYLPQTTLDSCVQAIVKKYNDDMGSSQTSDEKISCIANFIQRLDRLHPFKNGNIRTCYILLNQLLYSHHLPLCLLLNANRLDGCAHAEIVSMIKVGQNNFQNLLHRCEEELEYFEWSTPEEDYLCLKSFLVFPQVLEVDEKIKDELIDLLTKSLLTLDTGKQTETYQSSFSIFTGDRRSEPKSSPALTESPLLF